MSSASELDALRRAAMIAVGTLADACQGVPGVLVGSGPSLTEHFDELRAPVREAWCVMVAVPSMVRELARRGMSPTLLVAEAGLPPTVALYLALRSLGCDPVVLIGLDLAFTDGLVAAPGDELLRDWACELNPFHTVESLHLDAVHFGIDAADEVRHTESSCGPIVTTRSRLEERELIEALIAQDLADGRITLELDGRGPRTRGARVATISTALPRRSAVMLSPVSRAAVPGALTPVAVRLEPAARSGPLSLDVRSRQRVAAVVAIDPERGGTGVPRHVDSEFASRSVLSSTLERLGQVRGIEGIILLVPSGFDPRALFDPARVGCRVEVEECGASPFPPEQAAIRTARLWSDTSWRGGINGACVWDEILAPSATLAALERRGIDGALCCGPDWPMIMVDGLGGCDELVDRFRAGAGALDLAFSPSAPGLAGCVVARSLLERLAQRSGPALIGERLRAHPRAESDPGCTPPAERSRRCMVRAVFDSMRAKLRLRRAIEPIAVESADGSGVVGIGGWTTVEALEHQFFDLPPAFVPQHLIIELNTGRRASGSVSPHRWGSIQRTPMNERLLERILEETEPPRDVVITFGHVGDPLWHPELPRFVRMAREAGARAVHVRTECLADEARLEALLDAQPDVISVDLHALSSATYSALMGMHSLARAVANVERIGHRRGNGDPRFGTPLCVARIQRRAENAAELAPFVEHWERVAGAAVIEGVPIFAESPELRPDSLIPAEPPIESVCREGLRRMVILSDGRVPISELDVRGERTIGSVQRSGVFELWRDLMARRRQHIRDGDGLHPELRWWHA